MIQNSLITFSKLHEFQVHHYEQDTLVSPAQSLFFISEIKSPESEVPQDWCEQVPYPSSSFLTIWLPVEREPPGHTKDFCKNFLQLFCLFSLLMAVGNTSKVLGKLTSSDSARRLLQTHDVAAQDSSMVTTPEICFGAILRVSSKSDSYTSVIQGRCAALLCRRVSNRGGCSLQVLTQE